MPKGDENGVTLNGSKDYYAFVSDPAISHQYSMMEEIIDDIWNALCEVYGSPIWVKPITEVRRA